MEFRELFLASLVRLLHRLFFLLYFILRKFSRDGYLTLIWVGFLRVRFEGGRGEVKLPPPHTHTHAVKNLLELCQKLEIWRVSTHSYVVPEDIPCSTKVLLICLCQYFFEKNQRFLAKIIPFLKAIV